MLWPFIMPQTRRLLIIDHDPALLVALSEFVGRHLVHVVVEVAQTAAAALHAVTVHHFDAILCDVAMPHMDGFALLCRIRQVAPDTRVVLMTGSIGQELERAARTAGASGLIRKPISRQDLIRTMTSLLAAHAC